MPNKQLQYVIYAVVINSIGTYDQLADSIKSITIAYSPWTYIVFCFWVECVLLLAIALVTIVNEAAHFLWLPIAFSATAYVAYMWRYDNAYLMTIANVWLCYICSCTKRNW